MAPQLLASHALEGHTKQPSTGESDMGIRTIYAWAVGGAFILLGCGDGGESESEQPQGTAPVIETLAFDPKMVPAGQQTVITGKFSFRDAESDADRFAAALTTPDGTRHSTPNSPTQGTEGMAEGQVMFLVPVAPPAAGTYTLELWMIDAENNESNHLDGALEATAP
jgi:hypothetical protein